MHRLLGDDTVLVVPSTAGIALRLGTPEPEFDAYRRRALSIVCVAGLAGLPQVRSPEAKCCICRAAQMDALVLNPFLQVTCYRCQGGPNVNY